MAGGTLTALIWSAAHAGDGDVHGDRRQHRPASVTVNAGGYTDVAGNLGSSGTDPR